MTGKATIHTSAIALRLMLYHPLPILLLPELPVELFGDEVRIKQILINVLNNAIKYTDKGAVQLAVSCERDKTDTAFIFFTVKDTGIGIKKESIPYLFTAFKRLDEKKNQYIEGTGLGLSIVKEMVELMNGEVTVNSIYTKGSTFVVKKSSWVRIFILLGNQ